MTKRCFLILFLLSYFMSALFAQVYKDPGAAIDARVADLLGRMTLDEKIGQMTQGSLSDVTSSDIVQYCLGSVLSGGGEVPADNSPRGWAELYDGFQQTALSTRLGIPVIYGIDAVHGHNNVRDAVIFPHNIGLGAANDPDLMERIGSVTASEVAATGIDWTFAPTLAVVRDERWGRTYEGFAEDPRIHTNIVAALIRGLQGANAEMQGNKVVACAKHWIGDGGTLWGTGEDGKINMGETWGDESFLRSVHLPPYLEALKEDIGTFMVSFSSVDGVYCTGNEWLMTGLLKNELGFKGFIVSDWNSIRQLQGTYRNQIKIAVNAGLDMAMAPYEEDWKPFISNLIDLVNSGEVSMSRIDDAVSRILTVKFKAGLFDHPYTDRSLATDFGSAAHREVAREAVRKSLVLLKNDGILPLPKNASFLVAGDAANTLVSQCGGWTIGWQGMPYSSATSGTTILQGLQNLSAGNVYYSQNGIGAGNYDFAVVVVAEPPYAEGKGDSTDLRLSPDQYSVIDQVRDSGTPYVVVLLSGRPMIMTDEIGEANAFVAAWLPGTEGQGVGEVLFGDYDFTGTLSYSWPRSLAQVPINEGDSSYDPLFPMGYGLTYGGSPVTKGDVNGDTNIDIIDALVVAQYYVGLVSSINEEAADVNCDTLINIVDALVIAQRYVGLISGFPCSN